MVMGASGDGWALSGAPLLLTDSVVVSMGLLRVGFLRPFQRRPKPGCPGTHGLLGRRVVLKRVRFLPHFQHPASEKTRLYGPTVVGRPGHTGCNGGSGSCQVYRRSHHVGHAVWKE